jgi:probable HAF family extracellular repeat protein
MIDLGMMGGSFYSTASAINARGQVVGFGVTAPDVYRAFLWDPVAGMMDLGAGVANGINERGQVVGGDNAGTALLWTPLP